MEIGHAKDLADNMLNMLRKIVLTNLLRTKFRVLSSGVVDGENRNAWTNVMGILALSLTSLGLLVSSTPAFGVELKLSRIGDATHVEFSGQTHWIYKLSRDGNQIIVEVPTIDEKSRVQLRNWSDPLIRKTKIESITSEKDQVVFTVASQKVQGFDYLTDQPSRLIVDFFLGDEEKIKPVVKKASKTTVAKLPSKNSRRRGRRPAATEFIQVVPAGQKPDDDRAVAVEDDGTRQYFGVFDGGDPNLERFEVKDYEIREEAIIKSQKNIYIRYPMLMTKEPYLKELLDNSPVYEIKPKETDENKQARLLLKLFNRKRHAVFLRTLALFRENYSRSNYDEIIGYLEADTYYRLWLRDKHVSDLEYALGRYRKVMADFPKSSLVERTELLVGYTYHDRSNPFGLLTTFERFLRVKKDSPFRFQVKISVADAYLTLNKYEKAIAVLEEVENDKASGLHAATAAYRKGDVHFKMGNYKQALAEYNRTKRNYPKLWKKAPNAFYNSSEALFWLGKYKASLDAYREFLQKFPASSHGGYAMTRIGELLEVLGAPRERIAGAYLECMFRFKGSPGAGIANIRLGSDRMPRMKKKEIEYAMENIDAFVENSDLPHIRAFRALLVSDGYFKRKEFDKTLGLLVSFYKENPNSDNLPLFKSRIVRTITTQIRDLSDKGDFMKTFQVYGKNSSTWLKDTGRIDMLFYLGKSFEKAGVPEEASKVYRQALNKLYAIRGTRLGKERSVFEKLPPVESINLRIAAVSIQMRKTAEAYKYLSEVKNLKVLSDGEKVERVEIAATVAEKKGQVGLAKKYLLDLTQTWTGQPEAVSSAFLRLARLQKETKDYEGAEKSLVNIVNLAADSEHVPEDVEAMALELRADNYLAQRKVEKAAKTYMDLLEKFEDHRPLNSVRYKAGKVLFETGDVKGAEKIWQPLKGVEPQTWHKLAMEQLESLKWKEDYKKYIDRIPAMSSKKKGVSK